LWSQTGSRNHELDGGTDTPIGRWEEAILGKGGALCRV